MAGLLASWGKKSEPTARARGRSQGQTAPHHNPSTARLTSSIPSLPSVLYVLVLCVTRVQLQKISPTPVARGHGLTTVVLCGEGLAIL